MIDSEPVTQNITGHASNSDYEYMVGAAAWQMSAEAHALMMQGFNLAQSNVDDMVAMADSNQNGYRWVEENGQKKLFFGEKHVAVVCDIDDTTISASCDCESFICERTSFKLFLRIKPSSMIIT